MNRDEFRTLLESRCWFVIEADMPWLIANMPDLPCLIRTGEGRRVEPASRVPYVIGKIESTGGYVRDVSTWPEDFSWISSGWTSLEAPHAGFFDIGGRL